MESRNSCSFFVRYKKIEDFQLFNQSVSSGCLSVVTYVFGLSDENGIIAIEVDDNQLY